MSRLPSVYRDLDNLRTKHFIYLKQHFLPYLKENVFQIRSNREEEKKQKQIFIIIVLITYLFIMKTSFLNYLIFVPW